MKAIKLWGAALGAAGLLAVGGFLWARPGPAGFQTNLGIPHALDPKFTAANTGFGLRLFREVARENPGKNVFLSPLSISYALDMTYNGAGGATQTAMAHTLGLDGMTPAEVNAGALALRQSLAAPGSPVELNVANALWADQKTQLKPEFVQNCLAGYGAEARTLDFGNPTPAADTINAWVSQNTRGKIEHIVSPPDLQQNTSVVLTNAIYFKGRWQTEFRKEDTHASPFMMSDGHSKTVPLMYAKEQRLYLNTGDFQAVQLPYGKGRFRMMVLLPAKESSLAALLQSLTPENWQTWQGKFRPAEVYLKLPRFRAGMGADLKTPLTTLGMGAAFQENANFSRLSQMPSFIGEVKHKAIVEVSEEGTVAAAATAVIIQSKSISLVPVSVHMVVDRPFICAIEDTQSGTLLFLGAISDPQ